MSSDKNNMGSDVIEKHAETELSPDLGDAASEEKKRIDPKDLKAARKEKKSQAQEKAEGTAQPVVSKAKAETKGKDDKAKGKDKGKGGKKEKEGDAPFVRRAKPARLREKYIKEVVPALQKQFGYKSIMQVPRLTKITINMGMGEALQNPKILDAAESEMRAIAGQKPVITKARKSIATFKLRQGQKIGCMVTLRKERMYEFLDRLVNLALPRTRDFRGISSKAFDGRGNLSIGIREQIIFSEIDYDKIEKIHGLNISIVTTARTDEEGRALLTFMGVPFRS